MNSSVGNLRWCSNCLSMSTRPRISFDKRGWCNACVWTEEKKTLDWESRQKELENLLNKHRKTDGAFDCLVPCSGGKDGSYVAYNLKHKYGMNPLCLTITLALALDLGEQNLKAFVNSGYNHITVNPVEISAYKRLGKGQLQKNYSFAHISFFIDELVVLDISRGVRNQSAFCETLEAVAEGFLYLLPLVAESVQSIRREVFLDLVLIRKKSKN